MHGQFNIERDARAMGWLMVGQLIKVTIYDGHEAQFKMLQMMEAASDTNTETENPTTTEDDTDEPEVESELAYKFGARKNQDEDGKCAEFYNPQALRTS